MILYTVSLTDIKINLPVGVGETEHGRLQPVVIDVIMDRNVPEDHQFNHLKKCIDYSHIYAFIRDEWVNKPHTELLEELAIELMDYVFRDDHIETCAVTIKKPAIFHGQALPSITLKKSRAV